MALQKVVRNMLNTGVSDSSDATAITIDSSENVTFAGTVTSGAVVVTGDANPALEVSRGSANTTNFNLKYNTTLTGQLSAANEKFQISAAGSGTEMEFYTNGAKRLEIDTSGKVGIGKTPSTWFLDVDSSGTNVVSFDGSNNTGVVINSSSSIADIIGFSNSASSYNALNIRAASGTGLVVDTSNNVGLGTTSPKSLSGQRSLSINASVPRIDFKVGDVFKHHILAEAEYMSIGADADNNQSNSRVIIEADNAGVARFDSDGIKFGADTAAANALDDYEEGTWTPHAGPGSSQSYSYRSGNYTKVGRLVTAYFGFLLNAGTFTGSEAVITGLPYSVQTTGSYQEPQFIIYTYGNGPTGISGAVGPSNSLIPAQLSFYLNGGESQGRGRKFTANADTTLLGNEAFDSNTFVKGVVIYYTS